MKALIKLALAALITYAAWNAGSAWVTYIRFKDAVSQLAQYGAKLSDDDLRAKVAEAAEQYDLPFDDFTVRRETDHTLVDGSYTQPVNLLPWYAYPYTFQVHVDTFILGGLK